VERLVDYGNLVTPTLDQKAIDAALKRLDERLFLDPEVDVTQSYLYFTVKYHVAGDQPPVLILEWRHPPQNGHIGEPKELSYGIVEAVKQREGGSEGLVERVIAKNRERQERIDRDKVENLLEVMQDIAPRLKPTRSAVLHRGEHLARSRRKRRARGEKC
jgi:hypothetical protein